MATDFSPYVRDLLSDLTARYDVRSGEATPPRRGLDDEAVEVIVRGMRKRWGAAVEVRGTRPDPRRPGLLVDLTVRAEVTEWRADGSTYRRPEEIVLDGADGDRLARVLVGGIKPRTVAPEIAWTEYEPSDSPAWDDGDAGPPLGAEAADVALAVAAERQGTAAAARAWTPTAVGEDVFDGGRAYRVVARERRPLSPGEIRDMIDDGVWHGPRGCAAAWTIRARAVDWRPAD